MAKDLSNVAPSPATTPTAPAQRYATPAQDAVEAARVWLRALGRKSSEQDLLDEPAPHRNVIVRGASEWLAGYTGDFDYLLSLQATSRSLRRGQVFPSYRQAAGILNCLRAEMGRTERQERAKPQPATSAGPQASQVSQEPARIAVEDQGVYVMPDGAVVKVQANREKTKTYAKRWTPIKHLDRLMEAGQHEHGEYLYEAGLVQEVARVGRKMTLAEAKAHSVRYGRCVRCGRTLTDGKSVEQGMGPVCIRYFGGY